MTAAFSWGIDALIHGSFMTLASGLFTRSPSSARSSDIFCWSVILSGNLAMILPAREMSLVSTATPAASAYDLMIGSSEWVASAGASSTLV